jgi:hypothetical protein
MVVITWATGCAPQPTPLRIDRFAPMDEATCTVTDDETLIATAGTLDVAPGNTPSFIVGISISGGADFVTPAVTLNGGQVLEPENRNRPILNQVVTSYVAKPASGLKLPTSVTSRSFPLTEDGKLLTAIELISPDVATELADVVQPGDDIELTVTVEIRGYLSGNRAAVTTGPLAFPLRVIKTDPSTCTVRQPAAGQCLYPGQLSATNRSVCCEELLGASGCP